MKRLCGFCGGEFDAYPADVRRGQAKYCSRSCAIRKRRPRRPRTPLAERFWAKVNKNGPVIRPALGPCWLWTAAALPKGYGTIEGDAGKERAHRAAWVLTSGPIPDGLHVLHFCDNPPCVNPDHLFLGTNTDNVADKMAKGRQWVRIPDETVRLVEARYRAGGISQAKVAAEFGISQPRVNAIVNGKTRLAAREGA